MEGRIGAFLNGTTVEGNSWCWGSGCAPLTKRHVKIDRVSQLFTLNIERQHIMNSERAGMEIDKTCFFSEPKNNPILAMMSCRFFVGDVFLLQHTAEACCFVYLLLMQIQIADASWSAFFWDRILCSSHKFSIGAKATCEISVDIPLRSTYIAPLVCFMMKVNAKVQKVSR